MLDFVPCPIDQLRPLAMQHKWLLQVLLTFADDEGRCWPALRTIARAAGESLSSVQKNLAQMEALAYFTRARLPRGRSYIYAIDKRFLPRWRRKESALADSESASEDSRQHRSNGPIPGRDAQNHSHPESTLPEQKAKPEKDSYLKNTRGALGRCAPSEEDHAHVADCVAEATETLTGRRPARARIGDEAAYAAAVAKQRRDTWLSRLAQWVSQRLDGAARMQAWEALDEAQRAGSRAATPKAARQAVDRLDKLYRSEIGRRTRDGERDQRPPALIDGGLRSGRPSNLRHPFADTRARMQRPTREAARLR